MHCPQCGTENPGAARFCLSCGTSLARACPECNTQLPPEARFCFACGAEMSSPAVTRPAPPSEGAAERLQRLVPAEYAERLLATRGQVARERRTLTILFSDVKGSTALAEDLDPEDVMEIMDGALDVLIEPVYRYEGTLARLMGDAVLAFFGAPVAHEDDPERACRAALEITAGAQRYAEKLERERGIKGFNVRVGIHTGLVVVGEVGSDQRVEYTAMGDAINLASRMESAAQPGTVLITGDTHKLVASLFQTEALGPIEVKGKARPVPAYRVLAPREVPGKRRGIVGLESPLVGREAELGTLRDAVDGLQSGTGRIVTVVGEAGIGKSRLVAELRKGATHLEGDGRSPLARALHLKWLEGRCLSYGASIAYLLWLDVVRGLLGVTLEDRPDDVREALEERVRGLGPERLEEVYPYLARLMSLPLEEEVEEHLDDLDGHTLREHTFAAVETLLASTARERPLMVVCEDLHWADPTSLQLLEHLFPLTTRLPLLFLCLFRPVRDHGSWRLREAIRQDHAHTDLCLEPLSAEESETLVTNLLWMEGLPPALKERILGRAEGNPFYLEEILRSLIDQRAIAQDPASGHWQARAGVEEIAIPDTLEGALVARIDRLQEETRHVLQLASVIGRIFLYRVLAAIAAAGSAAAEAAAFRDLALGRRLETLQREELIRELARLPELEYIFKHDLTREAAYNGLLKRHRRTYHRQVAEALERLFPDRLEEQLGLLAHHWERAGDAEKATEYLLRAGDQARLAYAHEEAADYYHRTLAFQKEQEDHKGAGHTFMKLGLTFHSAFDYEASQQAYDEGFAEFRRAGQAEVAVELPPAPHAFRMSWPEPSTLDPTRSASIISHVVIDQLFSGLVELSPELDVLPDVAQSWEVTDGGRKYVFHLRDDVRWSDGVRLTAHDFEYAWKRLLAPDADHPWASLHYDIKGARAFHERDAASADRMGVRALDDRTLQVELEGPTAYFLLLLTGTQGRPVPRHAVDSHGEAWTDVEQIVTCGPFRLESYQPGTSIVLARDPDYHGRRRGNLQQVELDLMSQAMEGGKLASYEIGSLDMGGAYELPPLERHRVRQRHAGEYITGPLLWTDFMRFNVNRSPFADVRVRRAFVLATDRQALADVYRRGWKVPATGGFLPPGMPGHSADIGLPYDPTQARQLLAEAGYPDGTGFPVIEVGKGGLLGPEVEHLTARWREHLGVQVSWPDPWDLKDVHLYVTGWIPEYPDPDSFLRVSMRRSNWHNEIYEGQVEQARRLMDHAERMNLYTEADRMLMEEAVVLPIFYGRFHMILKPWVKRYPLSPVAFWFWKDVVIEPH